MSANQHKGLYTIFVLAVFLVLSSCRKPLKPVVITNATCFSQYELQEAQLLPEYKNRQYYQNDLRLPNYPRGRYYCFIEQDETYKRTAR
jgi:hypothetical protein